MGCIVAFVLVVLVGAAVICGAYGAVLAGVVLASVPRAVIWFLDGCADLASDLWTDPPFVRARAWAGRGLLRAWAACTAWARRKRRAVSGH
jgi:hypothetical protein